MSEVRIHRQSLIRPLSTSKFRGTIVLASFVAPVRKSTKIGNRCDFGGSHELLTEFSFTVPCDLDKEPEIHRVR